MIEPETRLSLVLRLQSQQDQQAWTEFMAVYEPLLLRVMRQRGLQEADARDVTQQVVLAVTQAVQRWRPDGQSASFRRWLFAIARRHALKFVQRGKPLERGLGGSDILALLRDQPEPDHRTLTQFEEEYRNQVFQRAAAVVREEFSESHWQAFWRTCVNSEPVADVAKDLEMTAGLVYVTRSRIIARLRRVVEKFEAENHA